MITTLPRVYVSHRPYGGSTKDFLDGIQVGETRIAASLRQAVAVFTESKKYGYRLVRRRLDRGQYTVTRITEEEFQSAKPESRIKELIKEDPGISCAEMMIRLKMQESTVQNALQRMVGRGVVRRVVGQALFASGRSAFIYFPI